MYFKLESVAYRHEFTSLFVSLSKKCVRAIIVLRKSNVLLASARVNGIGLD